jgi:hypothetical protein
LLGDFFGGVFVRFSTRGVQKHHKNVLGKVHVKSFWPKNEKIKKKPYRVFGRFSA